MYDLRSNIPSKIKSLTTSGRAQNTYQIICLITTIIDIDQYAFPCTRCNRMYKHRASLNSHLKLECGVEPQFRCIACGRQFTWKQHLKRHMVNVHKLLNIT